MPGSRSAPIPKDWSEVLLALGQLEDTARRLNKGRSRPGDEEDLLRQAEKLVVVIEK